MKHFLLGFVISFCSAVSYGQTCAQNQDSSMGNFGSTCGGECICYGFNPTGYFFPTEFRCNFSTVFEIQNNNLLMQCVPSECPQFLYALGGTSASEPLCADSPYRNKSPKVLDKMLNHGTKKCASIVDVDNQTVGESLALKGLSFGFNHFSNLTTAYNRSVDIPLTDENPPADVVAYKVKVAAVDGGWLALPEVTIPSQANLKFQFNWDGKDNNHNPVTGIKNFKVFVSKVFSNPNSFSVAQTTTVSLGGFDAKTLGLGGWVPSIWRYFDRMDNNIYRGDGEVQTILYPAPATEPELSGLTVVADGENGLIYYFNENGYPVITKTTLTGQVVHRFTYDTQKRLISIEESFGRLTRFLRDSEGVFTQLVTPRNRYTYDVQLNSDQLMTSISNSASPSEVYTMTYTNRGLMLSFQKPGGQISTFTYNSLAQLERDTHSGGFFYDLFSEVLESGNKNLSVKTPSGLSQEFSFQYNPYAAQWTRTTTNADGSTSSQNHSYNYVQTTKNGVNNMVAYTGDPRMWSLQYLYSTSTQGQNLYLYTQKSKTYQLTNNNNPFSITSMTETDYINGKTFISVYDGASKVFTKTSPLGKENQWAIDSFERVLWTKTGNLTPVNFNYTDENLTSVTTGGRIHSLSYNPSNGLLSQITNPLGEATMFTYDSSGRMILQGLPNGQMISYSYDLNGNLSSITPPGRPVHSFSTNAQELPESYAPPSLIPVNSVWSTSYQYNNDKKVTKITRPGNDIIQPVYNPTTGVLESILTAKGNYLITQNSAVGAPASIKSPSGYRNEYEYTNNMPLVEHLYSPTNQKLYSYEVSLNSQTGMVESDRVRAQNGTASEIQYLYNDDFKLTQAGELSLTYDDNDFISGTSMGIGVKQITDSYTYNEHGEMTSYLVKRGTTNVYQLDLVRDNLGRVTQKTQVMRGQTLVWHYTYDSNGRLTDVSKNGAVQSKYIYDANGNRTGGFIGAQTTTASYDDQDRLSSYNLQNYIYNPKGDLFKRINSLTGSTNYFFYDSIGNLQKFYLNDIPSSVYQHDGNDRVVAKMYQANVDKLYAYQDKYRIAAILNASGQVNQRYVYASKFNIPDYAIIGSEKYRIISDNLGSFRLMIRMSDGFIQSWLDHDEFGRVIGSYNNSIPFGFAGGFPDTSSGLVRFGARDYDPETGRWTNKDPIGFGGGDSNLYGYVGNDPINRIDPSGLDYQFAQENLWHSQLRIDDPDNPGNVVTIDLVPKDGLTLQSLAAIFTAGSVTGEVRIFSGTAPLSFAIPGAKINQSKEQDRALINRAKMLQKAFKDGDLKFSPLGFDLNGNGTNCIGFTGTLLGN